MSDLSKEINTETLMLAASVWSTLDTIIMIA
jgi:hypothetical protein